MPGKILIFSDTHLTTKLDRKKFLFLRDLILFSDRVIINGDFWDDWFCSFEDFIKSPWKALFPLLLDKNTVYLTGNHDPMKGKSAVGIFCVQQASDFTLTLGGETYYFEHGFNLAHKSLLFEGYNFILNLKSPLVFRLVNLLREVIFAIYPGFFTKSPYAKKKSMGESKTNGRGWLVTGHTHFAEIAPEIKYANSGAILHKRASYLELDEAGLSLKRSLY